ANFRSTRSSSGWSSQGGQTRNPYALDRNPCGSSSGSGVAAAAYLCAAAVGTETNGSIVCPAHANGVVGIKPTVGLLSRTGIIPISHSQDTAGPMARTVTDAAVLLAAMAGVDARDEATMNSPVLGPVHDLLAKGAMRGARIGVVRNLCCGDPQIESILEASLDVMRRLGATIIDEVIIGTHSQLKEPELEVEHYEFKAGLNAYLAKLGPVARVHSLEDLIAYNEANREVMMPYFGQEHFHAAEAKGPLTDPAYRLARTECLRLARQEGIDAALAAHDLDALVAPTGAPPWLTDWINGDSYKGGSSSLAAVAGYPAVSVPAGFVWGLPANISFFGGAWQEAKLIGLAHAFEQATLVRRPPQFRRSVIFSE
ncbi:MAG: amidase family protein, partial [Candidatus Promineifilaceae bacterium]